MFQIGQKVICVKTHIDAHINGVVKGKVFTIDAIIDDRCNCGVQIDIGIMSNIYTPFVRCNTCKERILNDGVWWFRTKWFVPLSDISTELSETTVESLLELETEHYSEQLIETT